MSPTAINKNIRLLINRFHKCAYVAYTATPFANVLIHPEAYDFEAGRDLYPRHFIINLPDPPGDQYVGAADCSVELPSQARLAASRRTGST